MLMEEHSKTTAKNTNEQKGRKWYAIDISTLPVKLCYLFTQGKEGLFRPYLVLFLTHTGLTAGQAGLINGVSQIGFMIGSPVWGYIADRYQCHRKVILVLHFLSIFLMCLQPYVSVQVADQPINKCPLLLNGTLLKSENIKFQNSSQSVLMFWLLLFINTAAAFFDGPLFAFGDAGSMQRLIQLEKKDTFPRHRLFGAVGFALGGLGGSALINYFHISSVNCYTSTFAGFSVLMICLWVSMTWLYRGVSFKLATDVKRSKIQKRKLKETLKKFHVIFFLMTVFVFGTTDALYIYFTFLFLKELEAPTLLNGIALVVANVFAILITLSSKAIKRKLHGTWGVFLVCFVSVVIRFLATAFLQNPWYFLLIQPLAAFWSLFVLVATEHIREISDVSIVTTMYGITNAVLFAVAIAFASIVGGYIYDIFGGKFLYLSSAILTAIWTVFIAIFICVYRNTNQAGVNNDVFKDGGESCELVPIGEGKRYRNGSASEKVNLKLTDKEINC